MERCYWKRKTNQSYAPSTKYEAWNTFSHLFWNFFLYLVQSCRLCKCMIYHLFTHLPAYVLLQVATARHPFSWHFCHCAEGMLKCDDSYGLGSDIWMKHKIWFWCGKGSDIDKQHFALRKKLTNLAALHPDPTLRHRATQVLSRTQATTAGGGTTPLKKMNT